MSEDTRIEEEVRDALRDVRPGDPCPDDETLGALAAGVLEEADAEPLREHLASCRRCAARARDARRFVEALATRRRRAVPAWTYAAAAVLAGIALVVVFQADRPLGIDVPLQAPPYAASETDILWRGAAAPDDEARDAAMRPYQEGQYRAAARNLERYLQAHPDDDTARFYLGVSRLLSGDAGGALPPLRVVSDGGGPEAREASWYLALALVKAGRTEEARPILESLGEKRARDLLGRLP